MTYLYLATRYFGLFVAIRYALAVLLEWSFSIYFWLAESNHSYLAPLRSIQPIQVHTAFANRVVSHYRLALDIDRCILV
ncbi:hypothetical protein EDD22DRAFT_865237 [Suillus occidentalis]|nr:hypothetical protein EDD22DRAFT_865237 [Suillus occidentalis]